MPTFGSHWSLKCMTRWSFLGAQGIASLILTGEPYQQSCQEVIVVCCPPHRGYHCQLQVNSPEHASKSLSSQRCHRPARDVCDNVAGLDDVPNVAWLSLLAPLTISMLIHAWLSWELRVLIVAIMNARKSLGIGTWKITWSDVIKILFTYCVKGWPCFW